MRSTSCSMPWEKLPWSWNAGAQRIHGYDQLEAIGLDINSFYSPEDVIKKVPLLQLQNALLHGRDENDKGMAGAAPKSVARPILGQCHHSHRIMTDEPQPKPAASTRSPADITGTTQPLEKGSFGHHRTRTNAASDMTFTTA